LKRITKGWTGAEVEQCVVAALTTAHLENRGVNVDDLVYASEKIVPLSKTMKEQCDHIRDWPTTGRCAPLPASFRARKVLMSSRRDVPIQRQIPGSMDFALG